MPEPALVAATPILLSTGGELWICSTPYGKRGFFYECYQNEENRFKVIHKSSVDVIKERPISPAWTQEQRDKAMSLIEWQRRTLSKIRFGEEYEGLFLSEISQFFPDDLIIRAMTAERPNTIPQGYPLFFGADIARLGKDETTLAVVQLRRDGYIKQIEQLVWTQTTLDKTFQRIVDLNRIWQPERIGIDSQGLGCSVFDHLMAEDSTKRKTIPMDNSRRQLDHRGKHTGKLMKEDLYNNLLRLMEQGKLQLLKDDAIFQSFKSVHWDIPNEESGKVELKLDGNYTHIVESLSRACHLASQSKSLLLWLKSFRI